MIPNIIHYCWFGPNKIDTLGLKCIESWKKHCPDFKFNLINEQSFNVNSSEFSKSAYENKKFAFVSDFSRLKFLYEYGGIYLDTDMLVIKSLNSLLNNNCFLGWESSFYVNASIIGTIPGHPFIKKILDRYDTLIYNNNQLNGFTIPKIITDEIKSNEVENIKLYEPDYFYPYSWEDSLNKHSLKEIMKFSNKNTYAIHLWNGSWHKSVNNLNLFQKIINKLKFK